MINLIILLIVGGVLGWLASIVMRTDAQQGIFLNIVVGIVGALLAGLVITPDDRWRIDHRRFVQRHVAADFVPGRGRPARDRQPGSSRVGPLTDASF
jgi:uncharacterized membrane protein YeaQ/YmgE (transglycosylase-associated protein family)